MYVFYWLVFIFTNIFFDSLSRLYNVGVLRKSKNLVFLATHHISVNIRDNYSVPIGICILKIEIGPSRTELLSTAVGEGEGKIWILKTTRRNAFFNIFVDAVANYHRFRRIANWSTLITRTVYIRHSIISKTLRITYLLCVVCGQYGRGINYAQYGGCARCSRTA